jgi:hypothetical protein
MFSTAIIQTTFENTNYFLYKIKILRCGVYILNLQDKN